MSVTRSQDSNSEANPLAYKGNEHVEDEEGEMLLLVATKLVSTPSILLGTNQVNGKREKRELPDWLV